MINDRNLYDYVIFTGVVTQTEAIDLFQDAHVFILPSVTAQDGDQEGIPSVLFEAQACGLPIISSQHSGIPELIIDGKSGLLVPEKDIKALSNKIEYLIEHQELWKSMGKFGRRFIEENYDIENLNKTLEGNYFDLINHPNK